MASSREPAFGRRRFHWAVAIVSCILGLLIVRLYILQVVDGAYYRAQSESNFVQERRVAHARGLIYDRAGRVLVDNRPSYDLYLTTAFLPDSRRSLAPIASILSLDRDATAALDAAILVAAGARDGQDAVSVAENVDASTCAAIERRVTRIALDGVEVVWRGFGEDAGCDVRVRAHQFPSRAAVFRRLQGLIGLPEDVVTRSLGRAVRGAVGLGRFKPRLVLEDIGFDAYARIEAEASLGGLPGLSVVGAQRRRYLERSLASHVLGFTNELTREELTDRKADGYRLGDRAGRRGIEQSYEETLRGTDGVERVVVDAKGRRIGDGFARDLLSSARREPAKSGNSLRLTIDAELQSVAETSFLGRVGSLVAIDVRTGYILALASFPTYDPNLVASARSSGEWGRLAVDPDRPLRNKAVQDHYAPGSTFKAITAVAGLREGLIRPSSIKSCPGYFRLGRTMWRCYARSGHGPIALLDALKQSCDSYFYQLGYELGPDRLADTARLFGFGRAAGLNLDRETPGIMPDRAYYERRFGAYTPGLVVNSSIGQGDVTVTPLQLAVAYAALVNGGKVMKPQIVLEVVDAQGSVIETAEPIVRDQLGLDEKNLDDVRESMSYVLERGGTAAGLKWRADLPELSRWIREGGVRIGGKTGTAQVVRLSKSVAHVDPKDVPYEQRDHAWFAGFAPAEAPEIVVVAMTEHGGFGGSVSAPPVAAVMRAYFQQNTPKNDVDTEGERP